MASGMHLKAGICILDGRSQCWELQLQRPWLLAASTGATGWWWDRGFSRGSLLHPGLSPPEPGPGCAGAAGVVQELLGTEAFPAFSRCELWGELVGFSCIF